MSLFKVLRNLLTYHEFKLVIRETPVRVTDMGIFYQDGPWEVEIQRRPDPDVGWFEVATFHADTEGAALHVGEKYISDLRAAETRHRGKEHYVE